MAVEEELWCALLGPGLHSLPGMQLARNRENSKIGYSDFDFFLMENAIPWWVKNWILRHIYKILFLIFWAVSCAFCFRIAKVLIWLTIFYKLKMLSKTQNFMFSGP